MIIILMNPTLRRFYDKLLSREYLNKEFQNKYFVEPEVESSD